MRWEYPGIGWLCLLVLMVPASPKAAQFSLQTGFSLFAEARFDEAAAQWNALGDSQSTNNLNNVQALRDAAFAYVLATVAYEHSFDARAYDTWGSSIRYYLESGTSWESERLRLANLSSQMSIQLNLSGAGSASKLSIEKSLIVEIVQELQLEDYTGPGLGLIRRDEQPATNYLEDTLADLPQRGFQFDNTGLFSKQETSSVNQQGLSTRGIYPFETEEPLDTIQPGPRQLEPEQPAIPAAAEDSVERIPVTVQDTVNLRAYAALAWMYFESNYHPETGMVDPVRGYHMGTMWDIGSNLAGYVAAERIGLIDSSKFLSYLDPLLRTLGSLELYDDELPNREYDVVSGKPKWQIAPNTRKGSGWSTLDIGRLLIWLKITADWYPERREAIKRIVGRWKFDRLARNGEMNGVWYDGRLEKLRQEGRWGYEQYSASGFEAWGVTLPHAFDESHLKSIEIDSVKLLYDTRNLSWLTSEPFLLAGIELDGIDSVFNAETRTLYEVQKRRSIKTGMLCAVSEDAVDRKPYFVYNCVYYSGTPWITLSHKGTPAPSAASLSSKACFGWFTLFPDEYSILLMKEASKLSSGEGGFYGGIYSDGAINKSNNVNSNAVILEAILYRLNGGKGFLYRSRPGYSGN